MANLGLLMSGAVSGLGKGIQKGLENYQSYVSTSALQDERNKMETERLKLTEGFAVGRENRGYAHSETMQKQGFTHAETLQGKTQAHTEAMTGMKITSDEAQHDQDRAMKDKHHTEELGVKREELKIHEQHYKDMAPWYKRATAASAKLDNPLLKVQVDTLINSAKASRDAASKYDELASKAIEPDKQSDLMKLAQRERRNAMEREQQAFSMLGLSMPSATGKSGGASIVDPDDPATSDKPKAESMPESASRPNLPRMGNLSYSTEDVRKYLSDQEEAKRTGKSIADVVQAFKDKWGKLPDQSDLDELSRGRGLLQSPAR